MTLRELQNLLSQHADKAFQLQLPGGSKVPVSFHITEVGHVKKSFIDCGGQFHETESCQLQAWVGSDEDHRIASGKLVGVLRKASFLLPDPEIPVEIEYEDTVISQYPVERAEISGAAVILHLTTKHTDCLAKELCVVPKPGEKSAPCCGPGCC
jgi:hypothetical protein